MVVPEKPEEEIKHEKLICATIFMTICPVLVGANIPPTIIGRRVSHHQHHCSTSTVMSAKDCGYSLTLPLSLKACTYLTIQDLNAGFVFHFCCKCFCLPFPVEGFGIQAKLRNYFTLHCSAADSQKRACTKEQLICMLLLRYLSPQ